MASVFKVGKSRRSREGTDYHGKVRLDAYRFRRVRLCSDKGVSETWLRDLQAAVDRKRAGEPPKPEKMKDIPRRLLESLGLVSKIAVTRRKSWDQHVDDYARELETKGCNPTYVANAKRYLKAVRKACSWRSLADADRDDFAKYIGERKEKSAGSRTLNNIRATAIAFIAWAVKARRVDGNDLLAVDRLDQTGDRRRVRRALGQDECVRLLGVAGDRQLCCRVALGTGLRRRELRLLEWRDVRLDGLDTARPYLSLRPEATKSKRLMRCRCPMTSPGDCGGHVRLSPCRPCGCSSACRRWPHGRRT